MHQDGERLRVGRLRLAIKSISPTLGWTSTTSGQVARRGPSIPRAPARHCPTGGPGHRSYPGEVRERNAEGAPGGGSAAQCRVYFTTAGGASGHRGLRANLGRE